MLQLAQTRHRIELYFFFFCDLFLSRINRNDFFTPRPHNQSGFYFNEAEERMPVGAKDQLVIKSAAPYCSSRLNEKKFPNTTMKKKRVH